MATKKGSQAYAAQDARRGRNDPCTCGSGRKWKRCHGTEPAHLYRAASGLQRTGAAAGTGYHQRGRSRQGKKRHDAAG
jgi:hypothetical protein